MDKSIFMDSLRICLDSPPDPSKILNSPKPDFIIGSFLAHLLIADEPMQSRIVHHVLSLASLSLLSSVDSPPVHRFDHRNFISYTYMHICP